MKAYLTTLIAFFIFTLPSYAGLDLGFFVSDFKYSETHNGNFFMQDESYMQGIKSTWEHAEDNQGLRLEGSYQWGIMSYTSQGSGSMYGHINTILDLRLITDITFSLCALSISPFFGYGYHRLMDDSEYMVTTTGHAGYLREQEYRYIPIGIAFQDMKITPELIFSAKFEYDYFLSGKNITDASSIKNHGISKYKQEYGYGARASIKLSYQKLSLEPFMKYWDIEDSNTNERYVVHNNTLYLERSREPQNRTTEFGIVLSYSIF